MKNGPVEDTGSMTTEDLSGHLNYDLSAPSVPASYKTPGPGRLRDDVSDLDYMLKEPVSIMDITADPHENKTESAEHVEGFDYKTWTL